MSDQDPLVPPEWERLSTFIDSHLECIAGSSSELRSIALRATKHIFDWALETEKSSEPHLATLLATLIDAAPPQTRSQAGSTSAQRRIPSHIQKPPKKIDVRETPLRSLFIEGMNIDQIWQQLDLRAGRVCENLQALQGDGKDEDDEESLEEENSDSDQSDDEDNAEEMDIDDDEDFGEQLDGGEEDGSSTAEGVINLQEEISDDDEDDELPTSMLDIVRGSQQKLNPSRSYSRGYSDLDDNFFDLAIFNAETCEVEAKEVSRNLDFADYDSAEGSEVDFFRSIDDPKAGVDDLALFYNDFFEPPPRIQNAGIQSSKVRFHERVSIKKIRPVGKGIPVSSMGDAGDEESDDEEDSE